MDCNYLPNPSKINIPNLQHKLGSILAVLDDLLEQDYIFSEEEYNKKLEDFLGDKDKIKMSEGEFEYFIGDSFYKDQKDLDKYFVLCLYKTNLLGWEDSNQRMFQRLQYFKKIVLSIQERLVILNYIDSLKELSLPAWLQVSLETPSKSLKEFFITTLEGSSSLCKWPPFGGDHLLTSFKEVFVCYNKGHLVLLSESLSWSKDHIKDFITYASKYSKGRNKEVKTSSGSSPISEDSAEDWSEAAKDCSIPLVIFFTFLFTSILFGLSALSFY